MTAAAETVELTTIAAQAAIDKLAVDPVAYDVSEILTITDVFLVVTGANERQVGAIVDAIVEALRQRDLRPLRREGDRENRWVLLDYSLLVVHVQLREVREYFSLERLWRDCPQLQLDLDVRR